MDRDRQVIISAKNISIGYTKTKHRGEAALYNDLSFNLYQGELVCLIGANGAGKSTLLRTISSSQPVLNGRILFEAKDITLYSEKELSRLLGLVLTDKTSTGGLLVRELVELGRYPYTGFFGQLDKEDKQIVEKAMVDVGIIHKAGAYVAELSDGERQKAMIAKALAQECPVVLLDEPTAFLDIESRIDIMNLLHHLAMYQGKTILLSTHDIDLAMLLADRLWLLSRDKGLVEGVTEDIVLSGAMDYFFKGENIIFNKDIGTFLPNRKHNKKVFVKIKGELFHQLYHWLNNALERHGFVIVDKKEDSLFTVEIFSPLSMRIESDKVNLHFENFEQLTNWLKIYGKK
ncbi:MAG: ABC transporter ATP-binding protein [Dysgonomonas sp.]